MLNKLGRIFNKICMGIGALLFSQFPLFIQYYTQQLSGRVIELKWQIDSIRQVALQSGKDINQYIQKFLSSSDSDFVLQGEFMHNMISRWNYYSEGLWSLEHSTVLMKGLLFIKYFDWSIAQSTYELYHVGFSFNTEGLIYAGIGLIIGYLLCSMAKLPFTFANTLFRKKGLQKVN